MIKQKQYQMKPTSELILVRVVHTLGMAFFAVSSTLYFKSLGMSNAAIGLTTSIGLGLNLAYALLLPKLLRTKNIVTLLRSSIAFIAAMLILFAFTTAPPLRVSTAYYSTKRQPLKRSIKKNYHYWAHCSVFYGLSGHCLQHSLLKRFHFEHSFYLVPHFRCCQPSLSLSKKFPCIKNVYKKICHTCFMHCKCSLKILNFGAPT